MKIAPLLFGLALLAMPLVADTSVSGTINTDTTWTFAASPYVVTGGVTVATAKTLTIEPGVVVKFNSATSLTVLGTLSAVATAQNPIVFTSSAGIPTPGSWGMIEFQGGTNPASQISYATVSYGGGNGTVHILNGTANLDHVTVTQSSGVGIRSETSSPITLSSITVSNCTGDGLQLDTSASALMGLHTVTDSTFTANGGYGVNLQRQGHASIANTTITNNTGYAIGAQPSTAIESLLNITATGNGSGTKDALEYRGGTVSARDETWRASAFPWVLTSGATIASGRLVTIEPGSTIRYGAGASLNVYGQLNAIGLSGAQITFTSSAASPTPGSWSMIDFEGGTNPASQISYATISYGGGNGTIHIGTGAANLDNVTVTQTRGAGIRSETSNAVTFNAVTVSNCTGDGLQLDTGGAALTGLHTITASTFTANGGYGINLQRQGHASITGSTFSNNANYAITLQAGSAIDALSNITASGNGSGTKDAVEYRGGTVSLRDETWRASAFPWVVTGSPAIASGRVVSVEAGSTIRFATFTMLSVQGQLNAAGTVAAPITFTTSATTPSRGAWGMIEFQGGTNPASQMSYTTIAYSGNNGYAVHVLSGGLSLDHVTIRESSHVGISSSTTGTVTMNFVTVTNCTSDGLAVSVSTTPGVHTVTDSTFSTNGGWGANIASNGQATFRHTSFTANTSGGITSSNTSIDAVMCWWGDASGPSSSGFGTGQAVNANVKFEPWLATAPTTPQRFTSVSVQNRTFNPSISSVSKVSATTNNSGTWTLVITNTASVVVRTLTGVGTSADTAWDGLDGNGVGQPNGTYSYELQSTNGTDTAAPLRGREIIDTNRQLTLTGYAATPAYFSPNSDGVQDTTTVAATTGYDDDAWTLQIKNGGGVAVQTIAGTGNVAYTWTGRDSGGVLQPDGAYTAEVAATEGTATITGTVSVTLDNTMPIATISAPGGSQVLSNVYQNASPDVSVTGTIADANLTNWTLDDSTTGNPTFWTTIASGTAPVSNAQIALWQTLSLTNGGYNLRLRVWDRAGNLSTTTITPSVANFKMTQSAYQFNPGGGGTVTYTSTVPFTLTEALTIKDEAGNTARTLVNAQRTAGTYSDIWNGRNDSTALVPDGGYSYTATVTDGTHTMLWDTSNLMRGTSVTAMYPQPPATFDPFNNKPYVYSYTLSDSYRMAVEVGPAGLAYGTDCASLQQNYGTRCLNPWHYEAGTHRVSWWGTDTDGSFLPAAVGLNIIRRQDDFPQNVTVAYGSAPTISGERVDPALFNPAASGPAVNSPSAGTQTVTFTLGTYQSQPATIAMRVVNQANASTLRTITLPNQSVGTVTIAWDGRGDNGMWVAEGSYTMIVSATDGIGNTTTQHVVTSIRY